MVPTSLKDIAEIVGASNNIAEDINVDRACIDSRLCTPGDLFVALKGNRSDGNRFVSDAAQNGASAALVAKECAPQIEVPENFPLLFVDDPLSALQRLSQVHRNQHIAQTLAITGSNGKTIVKNALEQILGSRNFIASPGSFNSQVGLPLSVLSGSTAVDLAVLEVGVSKPGDMRTLQQIVTPDFGILTNIGLAHFAAFGSQRLIADEKLSLFADIPETGWILLPKEDPHAHAAAKNLKCKKITLGEELDPLMFEIVSNNGPIFSINISDKSSTDVFTTNVRTRSEEILTDIHFAASAARLLGVEPEEIAQALQDYAPASTRTEIWSTSSGFRVISDIEASDPASVHASLDLTAQRTPDTAKKVLVFAGMLELGEKTESEHAKVGRFAAKCGFNHLYLFDEPKFDIAKGLEATRKAFLDASPNGQVSVVQSANMLANELTRSLAWGDTVLFKGPRYSSLSDLARETTGTLAQRSAWIDVGAIADNVARFERHCNGNVKIMAVLKASAYGSEIEQLAQWLGLLGVASIGVSSTSEGVSVRKAGFTKDIYVLLPAIDDFGNLLRFGLIPVLHSREIIEDLVEYAKNIEEMCEVHLKIDTGMHRLGIQPDEALGLAQTIDKSKNLKLTGLCTHFSSAEDPAHDKYTLEQISQFDYVIDKLKTHGFSNLEIHAANTAGAVRFPQAHYSMIRIGLGLYGIYASEQVRQAMELRMAIGVTSLIASIRTCEPGQALGYNRTFIADKNMRVAVVPFGYNDGIPWQLSGQGFVMAAGKKARILGRVSMDQILIDVTDVQQATVGTEVLVYGAYNGDEIRPEQVALNAGTITHELLTRLGRRVLRIYREP